jgi:hypothetical protein
MTSKKVEFTVVSFYQIRTRCNELASVGYCNATSRIVKFEILNPVLTLQLGLLFAPVSRFSTVFTELFHPFFRILES